MPDAPQHTACNLPSPLRIPGGVLTSLRGLLAALSCAMVAVFLYSAFRRLHYPFEYDWIEDGMLASVRHIRSGLPLYQPPSVYFTPYLYTPIYLYLAAALTCVMGTSYAALRTLSIFATLGCFGLIYALVFTEMRRHLAAIVAVVFFAACYPVVQASFDVGRVDMLYLFFVLCAFYATRRLNPVLAALLWVLAFQTKQGVLPIALLALCHDWQHPRRVLTGVAAFVAGLGGSILLLARLTHGWYLYYVFHMAGGYGFVRSQLIRFLPLDLGGVCGIALLIVLAALCLHPPLWRSPATSFYLLGSLGMVAFTGYLRAHRGANVNSLLPAYLWIAVLLGLAIARLLIRLEAALTGSRESAYSRAAIVVLLLAATTQLLSHFYTPNEFIITAATAEERQAFEQQLRAISGDVLVLSHPEDALLAAKPLYAGSESIGSVIEAPLPAPGLALHADYSALLHSGRLRAVVLDQPAEVYLALSRSWITRDFLALYPVRIAAAGAADRTTSEPRWIYLPCSSATLARQLDPAADLTTCNH